MPDLGNRYVLNGTHSACVGYGIFDSTVTEASVIINKDISCDFVFCFMLIDSVTSTEALGDAPEVCGYAPGLYDGTKKTTGFLLNNVSIA